MRPKGFHRRNLPISSSKRSSRPVDEMGRKDLAGSDEETPACKAKCLSGMTCALNMTEMGRSARFHRRNLIMNCLNGSALASSLMGRNGSAIGTTVYCRSENLSNMTCALLGQAAPCSQKSLLKCTMKYLDGISDRLGCVSQHRNRSMVVVSSRNPQNNKVVSPPPLGSSQHQIIINA
jgi:hypothetical protein